MNLVPQKNNLTAGQRIYDVLKKHEGVQELVAITDLTEDGKQKAGNDVIETMEKWKKKYPGDFFIVLVIRSCPFFSIQNTRTQVFARQSCPDPWFGHTLYRYHKKEDKLEMMWTIPDQNTFYAMLENKEMVHPDNYEVLQFVLDAYDGKLRDLSNRINKELNIT